MPPKSSQFFEKRFAEYMDDDDGFDDDISVGSARGSGAGLSGLRLVSPSGLGSLTSPVKPGTLGSLGPSPAAKLPPPVSPEKPVLGGLRGAGRGGLGGLGRGSGLGRGGGLGGLAAGRGRAGIGSSKPPSERDEVFKAHTDLSTKLQSEQIEVLNKMSSFLQGLADHTLDGFKEVSARLNQNREAADTIAVQESLNALIADVDAEIAAKPDQAYILIPGRDTATLTTEEAEDILKGKSVHVVGSMGALAKVPF